MEKEEIVVPYAGPFQVNQGCRVFPIEFVAEKEPGLEMKRPMQPAVVVADSADSVAAVDFADIAAVFSVDYVVVVDYHYYHYYAMPILWA